MPEGYIETTEVTPLISSSTGSNFTNRPCCDNIFDKIWLTCLALILVGGFSIGIYLISVEGNENYAKSLKIVSRNYWHAQPSKSTNSSEQTVSFKEVLIQQTGTEQCDIKKKCVQILQSIQRNQMLMGEPDILYDFIIGGDGRVYEGRGWKSGKKYLSIAILGNFTDNPLTNVHKDILSNFLNYSVTMNKLEPCFNILTEHQKRRYLVDFTADVERDRQAENLC